MMRFTDNQSDSRLAVSTKYKLPGYQSRSLDREYHYTLPSHLILNQVYPTLPSLQLRLSNMSLQY